MSKKVKMVDYNNKKISHGLYFVLDQNLIAAQDVLNYLGIDLPYKGVRNLKYILADFQIKYESVVME